MTTENKTETLNTRGTKDRDAQLIFEMSRGGPSPLRTATPRLADQGLSPPSSCPLVGVDIARSTSSDSGGGKGAAPSE